VGGAIYAAGGITTDGTPTTTLWAFSPATGVWSSRASMPVARAGFYLAATGGYVYAIGGGASPLNCFPNTTGGEYSWAVRGTHTVKIVVASTDGGAGTLIDAFVVLR
jgi:hypothetical protein